VLVEAVIKRTEPTNDCSGLLVDLPQQTAVHCVSMRRLRRRQPMRVVVSRLREEVTSLL
jgi:hypothetical protein